MANKLDRDYRFFSLLRFALPSIVMMMFMSLYTMVDGFFISRFVGPEALSAVNIVFPAISLVLALGIMLSTGGSAVVALRMGQGDEEGAKRAFTLLTIVAVIIGLLFTLVGGLFAQPIARLLGADDTLIKQGTIYLRILLLAGPAYMLQLIFEGFFVTAGKPGLGLGLIVGAGITNMVLDYVFVVTLGMGVAGAALATVAGYFIPAIVGTAFFSLRKHGLRFARPKWEGKMLAQSCFNGSSEMVTNISSAVVTYLFNRYMLRFLGSDGVAAITIILYAQFLLTALYMGFSMGVAPIISFNYGAENIRRLHKVFRSCMIFIAVSSVLVFLFSVGFAETAVSLFSPAGTPVHTIAVPGFRHFAPAFLFAGVGIFTSALFTALSDGKTSAFISFLRTFGFILLGLLILPNAIGVDGVWLAVPFAEALSSLVSIWFLVVRRKKYHYA